MSCVWGQFGGTMSLYFIFISFSTKPEYKTRKLLFGETAARRKLPDPRKIQKSLSQLLPDLLHPLIQITLTLANCWRRFIDKYLWRYHNTVLRIFFPRGCIMYIHCFRWCSTRRTRNKTRLRMTIAGKALQIASSTSRSSWAAVSGHIRKFRGSKV